MTRAIPISRKPRNLLKTRPKTLHELDIALDMGLRVRIESLSHSLVLTGSRQALSGRGTGRAGVLAPNELRLIRIRTGGLLT